MKYFPRELFVTGTDTGIGKTVISAMLMLATNADYWKPIQTGTESESDTNWIKRTTQLPDSRFFPESYKFKAPLSPHVAAPMEGEEIDINKIVKPSSENSLIIEGAGGIFCPVNKSNLMVDLIKALNIPAIIVTKSTLGTINHTLMTIEGLRQREIEIFGVIVNGPSNPENVCAIRDYGKVPIVAEVNPIEQFTPRTIKETSKCLY